MPKSSARLVSIQVSAAVFDALPSTRSTSGISAKAAGSVCAAQPVTITRTPCRSRATRRIVWRAWRTASAVTAQELTITAFARPAASAWRRMVSDSAAFSRQPKLMTSRDIASSGDTSCGEHLGRKLAFELKLDRPAHQHVIVAFAPFDLKIAARQRDADLATCALGANGGGGGGGSRRAAK